MTAMADPFRSTHLVYRAVEEEDEAFLSTLQQDPIAHRNTAVILPVPQSKQAAKAQVKWLAESTLMAVIICLPAPDATGEPVPIGYMFLGSSAPNVAHNRCADVAIQIVNTYQGQGYGSEAIRWILDFAFMTANLHRVGICAFEYNVGAVRLYERLGFKHEGVTRHRAWSAGRWWDWINLSMLEDEWRELQEAAS